MIKLIDILCYCITSLFIFFENIFHEDGHNPFALNCKTRKCKHILVGDYTRFARHCVLECYDIEDHGNDMPY